MGFSTFSGTKGRAHGTAAHGLSPPTPCSYCHLETTFSIYVYGAFPRSVILAEVTIIPLVVVMLLSVWLAYAIPKLLRTEKGVKFKGFWVHLCTRCRKACACFPGRC